MNSSESLLPPRSNLPAANTVCVAPTVALVREVLESYREQANFAGHPRSHLSFSSFYTLPEFTLLGPAVGSSAAVLALEPLLASGAKEVLLLGAAGALEVNGNSFKLGEWVLPTGAFAEEGTSKHYGGSEEMPHSGALQNKLEAMLVGAGAVFRKGKVWTTDAPYRESLEKACAYASRGAAIVEMEFSAILALCRSYSAELAALFVVSDLRGGASKAGAGGFLKTASALENGAH